MEEDEYKITYNELASVRCVFEKSLTNHQAKCHLAAHFCLADREGYSCASSKISSKCNDILCKLRENSVFVLKLHEINAPLPHNMEIRVQVGGLLGLMKLIEKDVKKQSMIADIRLLVEQIEKSYSDLDDLPFNEIIQSVVQFKGRQRKKR